MSTAVHEVFKANVIANANENLNQAGTGVLNIVLGIKLETADKFHVHDYSALPQIVQGR